MQNFRKSVNGITLMALVVTIIILLILAGISIGMLSGDNSIINQAGNAKTQTDIAQEKEILEQATVVAMGKSKYGDIEQTYLKEALDSISGNRPTQVSLSGTDFEIYFEDTQRNYFIDTNGRITEPLPPVEYSQLSIGDYVNYPVDYDNVGSYVANNTEVNNYTPENEYTGWRIIDIDEANAVVKLVSAGVPLNYKHTIGGSNAELSETNLTTNFLSTEITANTTAEDLKFFLCGFKKQDGTYITTNSNYELKELFTNKLTEIDPTTNNPIVQAMTISDINKIYGKNCTNKTFVYTDMNGNDINGLLAVPCGGSQSGKWAYLWLGTKTGSVNLWSLYGFNGAVYSSDGYSKALGIRPIVTLKANIKFSKSSESSEDKIIWNIR